MKFRGRLSELLKLDSKGVELQLKDDELEIGTKTRKAINDLKQFGKQKQCYLCIRSFLHKCHNLHAEVTGT